MVRAPVMGASKPKKMSGQHETKTICPCKQIEIIDQIFSFTLQNYPTFLTITGRQGPANGAVTHF
jgi:hypothetical protein